LTILVAYEVKPGRFARALFLYLAGVWRGFHIYLDISALFCADFAGIFV
jgi:hypothetical protein